MGDLTFREMSCKGALSNDYTADRGRPSSGYAFLYILHNTWSISHFHSIVNLLSTNPGGYAVSVVAEGFGVAKSVT
jgi:hypothetical protein